MKKIYISLFILIFFQYSCAYTNIQAEHKKHFHKTLNTDIAIFQGVYPPERCSDLLADNISEFIDNEDSVLDIGTGSGALGLVAAKLGAKNVLLTDINPEALKNSKYNARILGLEKNIETRLVTENTGLGAFDVAYDNEKFDLIFFSGPFDNGVPNSFYQYALYDPNYILLKSLFKDLKKHLTDDGVVLFINLFSRKKIFNELAAKNNVLIAPYKTLDAYDYNCTLYILK